MGNALQTVTDGLSYLGDVQFIVVNYILLVFTLIPFLLPGRVKDRAWVLTFISVTILQVAIWFGAGAVGISVIWSAMAGFNFLVYRKQRAYLANNIIRLLLISVVLSVAAIIYYAFTLPSESTVGHLMAVLIGMGLYYFYHWLLRKVIGRE